MANPPNFAQAVDLSSLGKPKPGPAGPMPGLQVSATNLNTEFLPLSSTKPVIIIVWSSRSPESIEMVRTLGALEIAYQGSWALGHLDFDAEPQVAQALQTKSVPYAIALIGQQMVPLFEQSYPEAQIRLVLDKVLTLAAQQGIGAAPIEVSEPEEDEAMAALEVGDFKSAEVAYKKLLARKPTDSFAKLGLAQTQLLIRTDGLDLVTIVRAASESPSDIELQLQAADMQIANGEVEAAFNRLLHVVQQTSGDERNKAREQLLTLFALVDPSDPRLAAARSALASALF
ncbi:MAG: co-chaperone YbbN [Actinobacteria bacterium]|nr:tetratricopeptide repeat protein [Candidatus Planktophila sp.]PHX66777.1 MAG: co-chaperone YbbN [Actinomycetota bacterium]